MSIIGYPDLLGLSQRTRTTGALKARMQIVSQEAVTGIQADLTKAAKGRVGEVHLLKKALDDIKVEDRVNSLASSRVNLILQGVTGARNTLNDIDTRALINLNTGSQTSIKAISEEARVSLKTVMSALSQQHGTRNLFSGDATTTAPFASAEKLLDDVKQILSTAATAADAEAALDTYFDDPAGGFNTDIYRGGDGNASSIRLSNGDAVAMSVKGDNQAIKDVLRGLSVMAASTQVGLDLGEPQFRDIFSSAIDKSSIGKSGLIDLEVTLGIHSETIEKLNKQNQAEKQTLTTAYQSIAARDQFEAAAELKQLEVALQSSYVITSRLSDLSLVNFLR